MFKAGLRALKIVNLARFTGRYISTGKPNTTPFRSIPTLVFGKYLLATNIISSGVLMLWGDFAQQEIEYRQGKLSKRYDYERMARMLIVGILLGPVHHYYYLYIARVMPKRNVVTVFTKIGLDQFIMSPICIGLFFYSLGGMERKDIKQMNSEIKEKFWEVYMMDWCVWAPTQFINFYFVPVKYQVLYINAVTMIYDIFLSCIKHREGDSIESKGLIPQFVNLEGLDDKKIN